MWPGLEQCQHFFKHSLFWCPAWPQIAHKSDFECCLDLYAVFLALFSGGFLDDIKMLASYALMAEVTAVRGMLP